MRNGNGNGIRAYTGLITSPQGGSRGEHDDATHTTAHPQPTQKRVWYTRCVPKTYQICTEGDDMTGHDIVEIATLTMLGIVIIHLAVGWIQDHINIK